MSLQSLARRNGVDWSTTDVEEKDEYTQPYNQSFDESTSTTDLLYSPTFDSFDSSTPNTSSLFDSTSDYTPDMTTFESSSVIVVAGPPKKPTIGSWLRDLERRSSLKR